MRRAIVADHQRAEKFSCALRHRVTADHELLLLRRFYLHPFSATTTRLVFRIGLFADYSLQSEPPNFVEQNFGIALETRRITQRLAGAFNERTQQFLAFCERERLEIFAVEI